MEPRPYSLGLRIKNGVKGRSPLTKKIILPAAAQLPQGVAKGKTIMLVYAYDGSFEGFLSAIFAAYALREDPERVECGEIQAGLLEEVRYIAADFTKSERVRAGILKRLGPLAYEDIYTAFLTPDSDKATALYLYIRLGFDSLGRKITDHFEDARVMRVVRMAKRVETEVQHLKGFIRFRLVGGVFYSDFEPDNDVLEALAPHFAERYADQRFIIEDKRRDKLIACEDGRWELYLAPGLNLSAFGDADESQWSEMWKAFHKALTIKERVNARQQRLMMPKRYWEYMLEMQGYDPLLEGNSVFKLPEKPDTKRLSL